MHKSLIRDRRIALSSSNDPYVSGERTKRSFVLFFLRTALELKFYLFLRMENSCNCQFNSLLKKEVE